MKKFLKSDFGFILISFLVWRVGLFIVAFVGTLLIPKYGNMFPYTDRILIFTHLPSWIWGFGNFDGVHYLKIAHDGYKAGLSQVFFPFYPLLINLVTKVNIFVPRDIQIFYPQDVERQYFYNAMLISNTSFLFGLYYYFKLIKEKWNKLIAQKSVLLLLLFPTSYYFGSVYTEGLFFLITVLFFYSLVKKNNLLTLVTGFLAPLTRINGILLIFSGVLSPFFGFVSLIFYFLYMYRYPFIFITSQSQFGANRSALPIVLLPQVFYRYLKMLITVDNSYAYFILIVELLFVFFGIYLLIISYRKIEWGWWLFSCASFVIPTMTGTFSSMPRYSLMLFLLFPVFVQKIKKLHFISPMFLIFNILFTMLYTRGYWIS